MQFSSKILTSIILVLTFSCGTLLAIAQDREKPTRGIERLNEGFSLRIPPSWIIESDPAYALLTMSPHGPKACTVRRTSDWSFEIMTIDDYYAGLTEDQILSIASIGYSNPQVHMRQKFGFGGSDGVHFVYSGDINQTRIVTVVFQTIANGSLYTLNCITNARYIDFDYKQFLDIASTFKMYGND